MQFTVLPSVQRSVIAMPNTDPSPNLLRGGNCFVRAKGVLAGIDLSGAANGIKQRCMDPSTLDTCITPELSGMVNSIVRLFDTKRI